MEQENQIPESVQQTNDDSIVSKRSAARFGYFNDEYLRNFVTKPPRRSPLINRGYYIRCKVIRDILRQFITKNPNYPKQIISLGAGFDTSYWILKGDLKIFNNFLHSYYEIDFDGVVARKTRTIMENDMLHSLLDKEVIENKEQHELVQELTQQLNQTQEKLQLVKQSIQETTRTQSNNNVATNCGTDNKKREELTPEEKSVLAKLNREKEQLEDLVMTLKKQLKTFSTDDEIHRRGYHLIKGDLRDIATLEKKLKFCNIDWKKPTLIFAECVLTYIHPEDSDKIIQWISGAFDNVLLMAYEQIVPKDAFGRVMLQTLKGRGSPLFGTKLYCSVKLMRDRYTKLGFDRCAVADLLSFYKHSMGLEEVQRIEQLEDFDEYEEWNIKCGHYAVSLASKEHNKDWAMFDQLNEYFPTKLEFDETYDGELKEMKPFESVHYADPKLTGRSSSLMRWGHSAVVVTGHQILIFGGFGGDSKQQILSDLVLLEPESFNCQLMEASGNVPEKRMFHAAEVFDGDKMLLFGGRTSPKQPFGDLFVLETRLNIEKSPIMRWKQIEISGNQPSPRYRHSLTLFDHYVAEDKSKVFKFLVFGGRGLDVVSNAITALNDSYIIELSVQMNTDPSTGFGFTYKAKSSSLSLSEFTPSPRFSHTATLIAPNQVMVCGGANQMNRYFGDTFLFDTDHWTSVKGTGQLPTSLFSHSAVLVDNEQMNPVDLNFTKHGKSVLLIGGCSKRGTTFLYLLNLENYRWTKLYYDVGTPAIFVKHTASLINERKIVLIGGGALCFSFGTHLNPVKVLTLNANVITPRASFEIPVPDMAKIPGYGNVPRSVKMIGVKSEVPVEINPSPERIAEIVANRKPVLIRGCKIGQCTEKWTAEYLKTKCIESKVSVRISKQPILDFINKNYEFIKVAFPEFMDKVFTEQTENSNDRYYFRSIGENPRKDVSDDIWRSFPDLAADFEIPEQFSFIKEKVFSSVFRISSQDIRMWTHYDVMDNILCQVVGSKKVVLWEPKEVKHLYVTGSTSKVLDIDNPDLEKFPKFAKANSMECVLEPGDILYIPACWWHNVITTSPSISINVSYKHLDEEAYTKKDLHGNKDLVQAEKAMEQLEQMISTLKALPPYYQEFYANYLLSQFKSKTNL